MTETEDDQPEAVPLPVSTRARRFLEQHPGYALLLLACLMIICYFASLFSAVQLNHAAHMLATTSRQVVAQHAREAPNQRDDALETELLRELEAVQYRGDFSEAMLHLSIAFGVAIIIILTVELYSAKRTRREINEYREAVAKEVWTALAGHLVPREIVDEIQGILKAETVRDDVHYHLVFLRYDGLPSGMVVLQRKLSYTLQNLTGRNVDHEVLSIITSVHDDKECVDRTGNRFTVPRHVELRIDGMSQPISEAAGTLHKNASGQLRDLRRNVKLTRTEDRVRVFMVSEELVTTGEVSGSNFYIQTKPVTRLTVSVENRIEDIVEVTGVELNHPNYAEFVRNEQGEYNYSGGVLPGQSLTVYWRPARVPIAVGNKDETVVVAPAHVPA